MELSPDPVKGSRVITLVAGQSLIFGYGSLLLRESMEATLGKKYEEARHVCALKGWRRSWDAFMPNDVFYEANEANDFVPENIIYLNVKPNANCSVNGLLYRLDQNQLVAFDKREWIYDRLSITPFLDGVTVEGGEAYVYTSKPQWLLKPAHALRNRAAVRKTYIEMIGKAVDSLGSDFRDQFQLSTDSIPNHLSFVDIKRKPAK